MAMTAAAKRALSTTIRDLRTRLLQDLHAATESEFRLAVRARDAGLDEKAGVRRRRFEDWCAEQARAEGRSTRSRGTRGNEAFRLEAEKQAASTLLNRLVLLRLLEEPGANGKALRQVPVVKGGWNSRGYLDFRQLAPACVHGDDSEGYAFLLSLVFEDLAGELPGVFGPAGVADLVRIPAATLRHVVDALNAAELDTCWGDDMTLGWVYQYWNDPEREALDDKLNDGGKLEPHEIASKTQMFTERYMVDWLLQNSLGPMWLAMCRKHGWTPEVEADGTLAALEERRADWRARREAGEVELTALMPLHSETERRWAYYVPQAIPDAAVAEAPESLRELRMLDPAVGSGHFLVVALDLLLALYQEEARHRGEAGQPEWDERACVEHILAHNLHGIDLDPRAVQIAAAALWLKAQQLAPGARPERLNLVASNLRLASLADDDPALVELRRVVEHDTGIPPSLTDTLVHALRGADYLGSLLQIDAAVDAAIAGYEQSLKTRFQPAQPSLFGGPTPQQSEIAFEVVAARAGLIDRLETFLAAHTSGDDLGLRLRGEQLTAGVRFVRLLRQGSYDLVVANPPYQGIKKLSFATELKRAYPTSNTNLAASFLARGVELLRQGGANAQVTPTAWLYAAQYELLRRQFITSRCTNMIVDLGSGAFEEIDGEVVTSVLCVILNRPQGSRRITTIDARDGTPVAKQATCIIQPSPRSTATSNITKVPGWPILHQWTELDFDTYESQLKIADVCDSKYGTITGDDPRFLRNPWECARRSVFAVLYDLRAEAAHTELDDLNLEWFPYLKGAAGRRWVEPLECVCRWQHHGIECKVRNQFKFRSHTRLVQNEEWNFQRGAAFTSIGANFGARVHRYSSILGAKGRSVFSARLFEITCSLNSSRIATIASQLNPSLDFNIGDVKRLPVLDVNGAVQIIERIQREFELHESHREPSIEFKQPGPSPWRHIQEWAQDAVDRPDGAPLPDYVEKFDAEPPTDHLSYALGVSLGRFGPNGEGILDPATADLSHALPHGLLFLDTTLETNDGRDGLGHASVQPLHAAWAEYGPALDTRRSLREWLAWDFFKDVHIGMYEGRPIHWPLSSANKTFVAWINIHRMNAQTLRVLLADHLVPTLTRLEGELNDLRAARDGADKKAARAAERQFDRVLKAKDELATFIAAVEQCADRGAPPTDAPCPPREQDMRYDPDLDDGVMINSAALWPLLAPQWSDPKKWWKELANARGRKDYDWSHLAMRYWPTRVDEKCRQDPSLGVAHGCFWRYHPDRAWAWELRLQDEIGPDFRIREAPYRPGGRDLGDPGDAPHRQAWLHDHPTEALAAIEKEAIRRMGRGDQRTTVSTMRILESGLWTNHPAAVWEMELRLAERQGSDFQLLAPDADNARVAWVAEHPDLARQREDFLKTLVPRRELFDDGADEQNDDADDADDDDEGDDSLGDEA